MALIYIIAEVGWEYNDSTYDRVGGSSPVKAYRSKEKAQAEVDRMNGVSMREDKHFVDDDGRACQKYELLAIEEPSE